MFDALPSALPHVKEGTVRAIGVTTKTRVKRCRTFPPVADTVPGYAVTGWLGIGVPKGTPADIIDRLNREINAVLADPEV